MRRVAAAVGPAGLGVALALIGGPALAHHSFGMFDMQKTVTVTGTVKDFQWANPHVWIDLLATDPVKKTPVTFAVEGDAVAILTHKGWSRSSLKPGDKVTVVVHPLKNGNVGGSLVSASMNGKMIGQAYDYHPS